jgi:hypothetical protein
MRTKVCTICKKILDITDFYNNKNRKDGKQSQCKICQGDFSRKYFKKFPWRKVFKNIKIRCTRKNFKSYKNYGGRGIKCLITEEELRKLWFRDKAYLMKQPSIDRKENDGNYTYKNCRFIELGENSRKNKLKFILQFDKQRNFIKEWTGIITAARVLNICKSSLTMCAQGKRKTSGGYIWKYK